MPCLEPPAYQSHHRTQNFCSFYLGGGGGEVTEAHRPSPQGWKGGPPYLQQILDLACQL